MYIYILIYIFVYFVYCQNYCFWKRLNEFRKYCKEMSNDTSIKRTSLYNIVDDGLNVTSIVNRFRPDWKYSQNSEVFHSNFIMNLLEMLLFQNDTKYNEMMLIFKHLRIPLNNVIISVIVIKNNGAMFWNINCKNKKIYNKRVDNAVLSICIDDKKVFELSGIICKQKLSYKDIMHFIFKSKGSIQIKPLWLMTMLYVNMENQHLNISGYYSDSDDDDDSDTDSSNDRNIDSDEETFNHSANSDDTVRRFTIETSNESRIYRFMIRNNLNNQANEVENHEYYEMGVLFYYDKWRFKYYDRKYTYINTKYISLGQELTKNTLDTLKVNQWNDIVHGVRMMHFKGYRQQMILQMNANISYNEECKYNIKNGSIITDKHLIALKVYSDCCTLCYIFRKTYYDNEYISKHNEFANLGRLLHEACQVYGNSLDHDITLYYGANKPFLLKLKDGNKLQSNLPLSTTTRINIAEYFAEANGMITEIRSHGLKPCKYIDMSFISKWSYEAEYFFCGSTRLCIAGHYDLTQKSDQFHSYFNKLVRNWNLLDNVKNKKLNEKMDKTLTMITQTMVTNDIRYYDEIELKYNSIKNAQINEILKGIKGRIYIICLNGFKKLLPNWYKCFIDEKTQYINIYNIIKVLPNIKSIFISCTNNINDGILLHSNNGIKLTIQGLINDIISNKMNLHNFYIKYHYKSKIYFKHAFFKKMKQILYVYKWDIKYDINKCWIFVYNKKFNIFNHYNTFIDNYIFGNCIEKHNNLGTTGNYMINFTKICNVLKYNFESDNELYTKLYDYIIKHIFPPNIENKDHILLIRGFIRKYSLNKTPTVIVDLIFLFCNIKWTY